MTNIEAIETLENMDRPSNFASSLCTQYRRKGGLSDKQWFWVDKLATESGQPAAPAAAVEDIGDFDAMVALFRTAKDSGLKYPKVRLDVGDTRVVLALCGPASKFPGSIRVTNGANFHSPLNQYFGRIDRDGTLHRGRDCHPAIVTLLHDFAEDPAGTATAYGQRTGSCCFCGKELTDGRSLTVGYGPVCADKYCLPWG